MIKEILQFLIITFLLILCYDTIDIFLNQLDPKKEKEMNIVGREIEGTKKLLNKSLPYGMSHFPVCYVALGFSSAFGFILYFCTVAVRKQIDRLTPKRAKKNVTAKRIYNETNSDSGCGEYLKLEGNSESHNNNFNNTNEAEIVFGNNLKKINTKLLRQEEEVNNSNHSINNILINERRKLTGEKVEQNKTFLSFSIPNLLSADMLPIPSTLLKNDLSASGSSLLQMDCSNSKNLCDLLIENRNISKVGLPMPRALYTDEGVSGKHNFQKKFYENNCELLVLKNRLDEESSLKSEDSAEEVPILSQQDRLMGLLSMCNNNVKRPLKSLVEKSTCAQIFSYTDSDLKNIEKRLEAIEHGLKRCEDKSNDWDHRINLAETELADLHEQIYTMFKKFEEEKRSSYIIVSQVSNESVTSMKREENIDLYSYADEIAEEKDCKKESDKPKRKGRKKGMLTVCAEGSGKKNQNEEVISDQKKLKNGHENGVEKILNDSRIDFDEKISFLNAGKNAVEDPKSFLTEIKKKSVALEALLDSQIELRQTPKRVTHPKVPPHIVPPYRRSSFAGTDSKAHLTKVRRKY